MKIGLMGSARGCGVTTFAMALAVYCASGQNKKTELLDFSGNSQLLHLTNTSEGECFYLHKICIRPLCLPESFYRIVQKNADYSIIDFGANYRKYREEFFQCDIRLALADLSVFHMWEYEEMVRELRSYRSVDHQIRWFAGHNTKYRQSGMEIIPVIDDPLRLRSEELNFLHQILPFAARKRKKQKLMIFR